MAPVRANEEPVLSEILSEIEPNLLKIMRRPAVPKIRVPNNDDTVRLFLL